MDTFTDRTLSNWLTLLDTLPEMAYRMTELLMAIFAKNGKEFKESLLTQLMVNIKKFMDDLLAVAYSCEMISNKESGKAHILRCASIYSCCFEDCSWWCVRLVETSGALQLMVRRVATAQEVLSAQEIKATPNWITPMLLFINLY